MADSDKSKIERKLNYLSDTKSLIRIAMENKGIDVSNDLRFREYADLINNLELKVDESDATVKSNDMEYGKIAYNNGVKVVGNVPLVYDVTLDSRSVTDDSGNEIVTVDSYLDRRIITRQDKNKFRVNLEYERIPVYMRALDKVNDLLGE